MRFDVLSIFPEFFSVLDLSLIGKAQNNSLIDVRVHNLRDWAHDRHRSVDDTPFGGGAGMLMKPDVWAQAIDDITTVHQPKEDSSIPLRRPFTLAIPTPSGKPLTQSLCETLARDAGDIVLACGRYEGIDARVAEYYRMQPEVRVVEYSLGDYVLNGGEVAAVALIEAVSRLVPGMVGNPESLDEESYAHSGLLEYPAYTRPRVFRGIHVPDVLMSGNHQAVARWRRDRAIERTARIRPDMIAALDTSTLTKKDTATLAREGWFTCGEKLIQIDIRPAFLEEAFPLAQLAQRTFPDAAPRNLSEHDIRVYIDEHLQEKNFVRLMNDPDHYLVTVACIRESVSGDSHQLVGYTWATIPDGGGVAGKEQGAPEDFVVADGVERTGPLIYLEKAYLDRQWRGTGLFAQMISSTMAQLRTMMAPYPEPYVWLGTNKENRRAQRAYRHVGFEYSGERYFRVGDQINKDVTMVRRLNMAE